MSPQKDIEALRFYVECAKADLTIAVNCAFTDAGDLKVYGVQFGWKIDERVAMAIYENSDAILSGLAPTILRKAAEHLETSEGERFVALADEETVV